MLAFQQEQQQREHSATPDATASTASFKASNDLNNRAFASRENVGSLRSTGASTAASTGNSYRIQRPINDQQAMHWSARSNGKNTSSYINHRSGGGDGSAKTTFSGPHWRNYHNQYQQHQQNLPAISTRPQPRTSNNNNNNKNGAGNVSNLPWRSNNNAGAFSINTKHRDAVPLMSSTFQGNDSPLLSGISLALGKQQPSAPSQTHSQKQSVQKNESVVPVIKVIQPLYDVPQPRTPHPLSPADSLKTPGYIDPESLPFELGSTITDSTTGKQYKLLSVLGEGSYAVVYLARCSSDGVKYALKCLSKLGLTPRQVSLQQSELEIHKSVCPHPHIVTLFSHFETRDWLFLVMERVSGPDLYDYITQHPGFNANQEERRFVEATRLFEQMIDAVAHIHAIKAYHRDLKPENFILGADGNLKLTDFGLATREALSTEFECGSKPYMSYENRNGGLNPNDPTVYGPRDDYSPRLSDVWALGVLFLNLLFAKSPWNDPSRSSCFAFCQFLREGTGFLVGHFPKLPREVADFLVTRVFCPESGRCNVLELKQWVHGLDYPFNPPRHTGTATPRPINSRHKNNANHRRMNGGNGGKSHGTTGPINVFKKWSPGSGSHSFTKGRNIPRVSTATQPLTGVALESAVAPHHNWPKSKSPHSKLYYAHETANAATKTKSPAIADNTNGNYLRAPMVHDTKQALSTSVPALVFSQIIPVTQAAAARKMMPREHNQAAAKAAAAILQSSMLCLSKNGLGQGKADKGEGIDEECSAEELDYEHEYHQQRHQALSYNDYDDDYAHSSWDQVGHLSEDEDVHTSQTADKYGSSGAAASVAKLSSRFPKQAIASSLGVSLAKSSVFDSDGEMDFSEPLSFDDTETISQHFNRTAGGMADETGGAFPTQRREPVAFTAASTPESSSLNEDFDVLGHFSSDEGQGFSSSTHGAQPNKAESGIPSLARVRFADIKQPSTTLSPFDGGNNRSMQQRQRPGATNSADSSLTATLVTSSVEYYNPHISALAESSIHNDGKIGAPKKSAATGINNNGVSNSSSSYKNETEADYEADCESSRHPRSRAIHRTHHNHNRRRTSGVSSNKAKSTGAIGTGLQYLTDEKSNFSWADDVEELPIHEVMSHISNMSVSNGKDRLSAVELGNGRGSGSTSDAMSWTSPDDQNQHGDEMFAMEL